MLPERINYEKLFIENNLDTVIDYLQLDIEPAENTFNTLLLIPFEKYEFRVITFEHDYYLNHSVDYRRLSRKFLESLGYVRVVGNISPDKNSPFEDWWVNPNLVDPKILKTMTDLSDETKRADQYMLL